MRAFLLLLTFALHISAEPAKQLDTTTFYQIHIPYTEGLIPSQGLIITTPDKNGDIILSGLKPIKNAHERTTEEIKIAIQKQLPENFANQISVAATTTSIKELRAEQQVLILGQVKTRGRTKLPNPTTLETLITNAEPTPFSATNRVILIRLGKSYVYSLRNPKHKALKLYPGDIIHVPQKRFIGR